jgi:hypothetical protein
MRVTLADKKIAEGHQGDLVFRISFQDLLVFLDGVVNAALVEGFDGRFEGFVFIEDDSHDYAFDAQPAPTGGTSAENA